MLANSLSSVWWLCSSPIRTTILFSKHNILVIPSTSTTFLSLGRFARVLSFPSSPPTLIAKLEEFGESSIAMSKMDVLKQKLELLEITSSDSYVPGLYYNVLCPKCKGGRSMEKSLSLHIVQNGTFAMCRCFRFDCGWADRVFVDNQIARDGVKSTKTEEIPVLLPLGDKLIAYFRERMISEETLQRNGVLQLSGDKLVIAFTYKQNGYLVGCKYRTIEKRFWQAKDTEKRLYGIDDIKDAAEVIIVEGEIDKLSMEEAGLRSCVSVPNGAPIKVSQKLPSSEKDTAYQYLWNCKQYFDKVSRIILATDGDKPGQALAEGLACRLGKERCWQVRWPKKDECSYFKDANEVLKCIGPGFLKRIVENAEPYTSEAK